VKPLVARWRPTHDPQIGALVDVVDGYRGGRFGFFSAHACNTFSIAVFFSLLVRSRLLTIALLFWSLTNCWTRLYLGVHFPGDILVGLLWGAVVGASVYLLFTRISHPLSTGMTFISSKFTSTGYQHTDVDVVIVVLVLTYIYSLIRSCIIL
jgi:undecaprenyl-diphosphatase